MVVWDSCSTIKWHRWPAELKSVNLLSATSFLWTSSSRLLARRRHVLVTALHIHTWELPSAACLFVAALCCSCCCCDDGHFRASLQQLLGDWVPCSRTAPSQPQMTEVWFISRLCRVRGLSGKAVTFPVLRWNVGEDNSVKIGGF